MLAIINFGLLFAQIGVAVALFIGVELIKKFAPGFFGIIGKWTPLLIGVVAIVMMMIVTGVFGAITGTIKGWDVINAGVVTGIAEVYFYEAIVNLILKLAHKK